MFELLDFLGLLLFTFSLFFVVFLHELGHALVHLACSKGDVNIYVGSYVKQIAHCKSGSLTTR
jgi:hypothetical protein